MGSWNTHTNVLLMCSEYSGTTDARFFIFIYASYKGSIIVSRVWRFSGEVVMEKKCAMCHILLDVACPHPACAGHQNESVGDLCLYCATNERENMAYVRKASGFLASSLADTGSDWTEQEERAMLGI